MRAWMMVALAVAGCGGGDDAPGGVDAGRRDAGASDGGARDAGPEDAGAPDAGPQDSGPEDAGPPDAGSPDSGPPDSGPPDAGPRGLGEDCGADAECESGVCFEGVCCTEVCDGPCRACDLAGSRGTCTAHAAGSDPEDGCGAVSCGEVFAGFDAMGACHPHADAAAETAGCDGAGACAAAADVCAAQPPADVATVDCHDLCQVPTPGTCVGATAGACSEDVTADDFDGTELGAHWTPGAVGMAPTFTVAGGRLTITDAALAPTPSMPANSWIYDLDRDRGNQMHWPQAIGTGDFEINASIAWSSTIAQLTLGYLALVSAGGQLEILAGFGDGGATATGALAGWIRQEGADASGGPSVGVSGTATLRVARLGGVVRVEVDGAMVAEGTNTADLVAVAIVTARHRDGGMVYEYGTFEVERIAICD